MRPFKVGVGWLACAAALMPSAAPAQIPPGAYASRQVVVTRALTRPRGKYSRVRTTSLLLHTVAAAGAEARVRSRYCAVSQDPLGPVRTTMGDGFLAAMEPTEAAAAITGDADGPWKVVIAPTVTLIGVDLEDPWSDPLPTESTDPRVTDPDADGHPGATVQVSGMIDGEVYMVQRLVRELRGTMQPDGTMRGAVIGGTESEVMGASNVMLRTFTPRFEPDRGGSDNRFEWIPVQADLDCDSLVADADHLFGD